MDKYLVFILITNGLVSYLGFKDVYFSRKYDFHIGSIRKGEQLRMITSGFLHADLMHLIFNMYSLFMFAPVIIQRIGGFGFLVVYTISLLAGNLLTFYLQKDNFQYRALGASGAVTGIVYAAILIYPDMGIYLFFIPIPIPAYIFGILYLGYSIYGMKAQNDNIGHSAHFGGAIGGFCYMLLREPSFFETKPAIIALLAIPIVVLFVLIRTKKIN